jgi:hypothetical protein
MITVNLGLLEDAQPEVATSVQRERSHVGMPLLKLRLEDCFTSLVGRIPAL